MPEVTRTPSVLSYNREYKDTLFRMIFSDKENLLSLYNAMNGTDYKNAEELEIVTLENAIYMGMKNDVAFLLCDELHLYEHQSTRNPNMPLRALFYIAREYEKFIGGKLNRKGTIYSSRLIKLPAPRFVVFYNGTAQEAEKSTLCLSDAYVKTEEKPKLELIVDVLNINYGMNREIMERCKMLSDYAKYVDRVRKYDTILPTEEAVERAIKECIDEDILAELLTRHRKEVVQMSIFEFDAEKEWKLIREDEREIGYEEGRAAGREEGKAEGEKLGEVRLARFAALSEKLLNEGRTQELLKAIQDEEYRKKLYEEYRL